MPGTPHKAEAATRPEGHSLRGTSWGSCVGATRLSAPTYPALQAPRALGAAGVRAALCVSVRVCLCVHEGAWCVWRGSPAQDAFPVT